MMVKHYWPLVHKDVALCRWGRKAPGKKQKKTSGAAVVDGVAAAVDGGQAVRKMKGGSGVGGADQASTKGADLSEFVSTKKYRRGKDALGAL